MALLVVLGLSHPAIKNVMNGLIWVVLPATLVVANDSGAYFVGFFFGM